MRDHKEEHEVNSAESVRASLIMISFGLAVLAFLVVVDRPHWFTLRPMSGMANALSLAAERHDERTGRTTSDRRADTIAARP